MHMNQTSQWNDLLEQLDPISTYYYFWTKEVAPPTLYRTAHIENINRVNRVASPFELLYNRAPRLFRPNDINSKSSPTMIQHAAQVARESINTMLRSNVLYPKIPIIGE